MSKPTEVQGEGNYKAAKDYTEAQRKVVKSGRIDAAARKANQNPTRKSER